MLDDMFDVVETAVDVGEAVLHTLKKRKEKKEQQEAKDEAQRKADRERPL